MKSNWFLLQLAVMAFVVSPMMAQTGSSAQQHKTDTFKVYGNCGMCKKRIEKASRADGVAAATWNADTKMMTLVYDNSKISPEQVQQKIAAVGHDTEKYAAKDEVYEKLPGCCLYERKKTGDKKKEDHSGHKHE